ncbi:MAG: hypothetical protein QOI34_241 [Verrucomicrobiota bacterium]|jgi:predicted SAM-dependent methyltransferase
MMNPVTAPSGDRLLLIWRTEFLFYTPERRQLAQEWNHVRLTSAELPETPTLINHRLDGPLPLENESFDAVYCFHTIEHLNPNAGKRFINDTRRLLKPGGVLRVSTPDLEFHSRDYLDRLKEQIESPSRENYARYHWAVCNLIDQSAREVSGGAMLQAIRDREYNAEHLKQINGDLLHFLFPPTPSDSFSGGAASKPSFSLATALLALPRKIGRKLLGLFQCAPTQSYLELSHERNLWMYDRVSLGGILSGCGFRDVTPLTYRTSQIPDWQRYNFDQSAFGDYPLEPSLYIEGIK